MKINSETHRLHSGKCTHCGKSFDVKISLTANPPKYCSSFCRDKKNLSANCNRAKCPNPQKIAYIRVKAAEKVIRKAHGHDKFLKVYQCVCGAKHIGHSRSTR